MFITPLSVSEIDAYNANGGTQGEAANPQAAQDRFLKLFIAQLNNQDPLNPLDNAQMTTQMAQINTVTGIQQVNQALQSMAQQFSMAQGLQGAALVGRQILLEGNALSTRDGMAQGSFSLAQAANNVRADILSPSGELLGSVNLGARSAGMHSFQWALGEVDPARVGSMQIQATSGGQVVTAVPLARQQVESVATVEGELRARTVGGQTVNFKQILAFL